MARGLAGAALLAVPVGVAGLIGFGASFSGVAGGLSAVASGPKAIPASAPTDAPNSNLNHAVVALASRSNSPGSASGGGSSTGGGSGGGSSGAGGGSSSQSAPTINTPTVPNVPLPAGGSNDDTTDAVNGTVNNVVGGVNDTVNGLLGK